MDPHKVFSDPEPRKVLMEKFFAFATSANMMSGDDFQEAGASLASSAIVGARISRNSRDRSFSLLRCR